MMGLMSAGPTRPRSSATGGSTSTCRPASSNGAANSRSCSPVIEGMATSTEVAPWRVATSSASAPVPRTRSPLSCMWARRGSSSRRATGRYGLLGVRSSVRMI